MFAVVSACSDSSDAPGAPNANDDGDAGRDGASSGDDPDGSNPDGTRDADPDPDPDRDGGLDGSSDQDGGPKDPTAAGAHFPITYDLATLTGDVRFVAPDGKDSATGTTDAPFASLSKAIASAKTGSTIVLRGGTYRQGNLVIPASKLLTIVAYSGETPTFLGSKAVDGGWSTEGAYKYIAYTPKPVTNGSGICFITSASCPTGGQNLAPGEIGKFPDQAWIGQKTLQQVGSKDDLDAGKFYVDHANERLYMVAADADQPDIEVSDRNVFMAIDAPSTTLRGLRVTRFSNTASDYGVINVRDGADRCLLEDVEVSSSAFVAVLYGGSAGNLNEGGTMRHVTVKDSNWMGVSTNYTDDFTMEAVVLSGMNPFGEFTFSPQSGALKTSRTRRTKVVGSVIRDNRSHGIWFDQSNVTADVANCDVIDNAGSGVFYEISDDFLLANTFVRGGDRPVKLAGSSGLKLVNNTIIGGTDPIGIYTDSRSKPGCADPTKPLCEGSYSSDRDTARPFPATLDWMPRLDLMLDNIVAYPTGSGYCGGTTPVCITLKNAAATVTLESVLHKAEPGRGIPETRMDGNVYANGGGSVFSTTTQYTSIAAFATAMAGPPVNIAGFEAAGRDGDKWVAASGAPGPELAHSEAVATPTDARINAYVPAGTKHFGVLRAIP